MNGVVIIKSVLGMDLKADIKDIDGNVLPSGCNRTVYPEKKEMFRLRQLDKRFFTHYNEGLIAKVINYRRLND
jgi:hypothetical protein